MGNRLQSSFRGTFSTLYALKINKLSSYVNFVVITFLIWLFKKNFFKCDFSRILAVLSAFFGSKKHQNFESGFWPKKAFLIGNKNILTCFFEKTTLWYPRNDTYRGIRLTSPYEWEQIFSTPERPGSQNLTSLRIWVQKS